jgi:hypothetical protein
VAEIHQGHLDEAESTLQQALAKDPKSTEAIANSAIRSIIAGKDAQELITFVSLALGEMWYLLTSSLQCPNCRSAQTSLPGRPRREERIIRQSGDEILGEGHSIIPYDKMKGVGGGGIHMMSFRSYKNGKYEAIVASNYSDTVRIHSGVLCLRKMP